MTTTYERPTKTNASSVGEQNRTRWTRYLRSCLFELVPVLEFMAAEEGFVKASIHRQRNAFPRHLWQERPKWTTARIRIDQMATLEVLQKRHLEATGKEISRSEVLAALMAAGLASTLHHADFGGTNAGCDSSFHTKDTSLRKPNIASFNTVNAKPSSPGSKQVGNDAEP